MLVTKHWFTHLHRLCPRQPKRQVRGTTLAHGCFTFRTVNTCLDGSCSHRSDHSELELEIVSTKPMQMSEADTMLLRLSRHSTTTQLTVNFTLYFDSTLQRVSYKAGMKLVEPWGNDYRVHGKSRTTRLLKCVLAFLPGPLSLPAFSTVVANVVSEIGIKHYAATTDWNSQMKG
ncbi:unnamed protein product [Ixodes pacificus]